MAAPPAIPIDDRLRLRAWTVDDAEAIYDAVLADQEHVARWLTWAEGTYTVDRADAYIAVCLAGYRSAAGLIEFAIEVDGTVVGAMGVPRFSREHREYEIGYWISAPYSGRGIITRCAQTLTTYLFAEVDAHRVQIAALAGNARSRAVAERLGFRCEGAFRKARLHRGEWHDIVWYGITEDEWRMRSESQGRGEV